ncbi:MAG: biosynthetic arginine decarboxylase [Puniceicoccales bacterium]|jgi:arginine decarboxylase|nr:biosynthetic arginine decarboxylase [Puniceicoccales bacterium]
MSAAKAAVTKTTVTKNGTPRPPRSSRAGGGSAAGAGAKAVPAEPWTPREAEEYYGFRRWGGSHFSVDDGGLLRVHPLGDQRAIRILDIIREAESMGIRPPLTIRVQDMLRRRVIQLNEAFRAAIRDEEYAGRYRGVFPIKVNQLREVVEEILDAGEQYDFGLEAGSKPELLVALALLENKNALLVCNGYKDDEYIRLALMGRRLGKQTIIVIEQLSELDAIIRLARETGVAPHIGLRLKLTTAGEGKWADSTGENAKFGLAATEIVAAARKLKRARMGDALRLVHFHIGSQVPNIATIKKAVAEAARYYCELVRMGFPMGMLDVGGGLGVDYDGSRSNFESSMNYNMEVYARDVVANVKSVCHRCNVAVPDITSESGRALVAPHSILIFEAVDRIVRGDLASEPLRGRHPVIVREMEDIYRNPSRLDALERLHDARQKRDEAHSLFNLGYLGLEERAEVDRLFWLTCRDIRAKLPASAAAAPDDIAALDRLLAEQYVCNFSVFQSLLDHWALDQLFPIAPVHRLDEKPTQPATLVDITCDSDGKVSDFIDVEDVRHTLDLHPLVPGKRYYLGAFLVGAYQDIMGDLHNLFGRVNEVHVFLEDDEADGFYIEETIEGSTTDKILGMIQYSADDLCRMLKRQIDRATRNDEVKPREGVALLETYEKLIRSKTYLVTGGGKRK